MAAEDKDLKRELARIRESKKECVIVVMRCRPLNSTERERKNRKVVNMDTNHGQVYVIHPDADPNDPPKQFRYDVVFDETTKQVNLYDQTVRTLVDSVLGGYNGTVFAYGQTGTGKTFTMEGDIHSDELRGVIPRAFDQIFGHIEISQNVEFLVRASFIEIYNDMVIDLLAKNNARPKLELKENPETGVFVKDLSSFVMKSPAELMELLEEGKTNRQVGATKMNANSSRSHCIFTIWIESSEVGDDGQSHIKVGKLNMVDLAGSERQSKTEASGIRLKEATKINLSLSALGNVISALTSKKVNYIPYRDSKLTRLLQDSLGGNTKTVMIANVGPADYNYDETISTLRFANRAKNIKNKPKINEDPKDAMLREFQEEIARLKAQIAAEGGADFLFDQEPGPNGQMLPRKKIVTTKVETKIILKGVDEQKILELQHQAEEKKKTIAQKALAEMESIRALTAEMDQKTDTLVEDLKSKEALLEQKRQDKVSLKQKLQAIEGKLLVGKKIIDEGRRAEIQLAEKKAQIERQRLEQERVESELQEKALIRDEIQEKYDSTEKELQSKTKKLNKMRTKYREIKNEIEDISAEQQREREELLETIRQLTRVVQLKELIAENFVGSEEYDAMERRTQWDDERQDWVLLPLDPASAGRIERPIAKPTSMRPTSEFARYKTLVGDTNPRFKTENIVNLELDMPERTTQDYSDLQMQMQEYQQSQQGYQEGGHYDEYYDDHMYGHNQGHQMAYYENANPYYDQNAYY